MSSAASASTASTQPSSAPRNPLRILSLDGGGFRGLSPVLILQALMQRVCGHDNVDEIHLGNYFDLIVGTSTGGLQALMLGRLGMSVGAVETQYMEMGPQIFNDDRGKMRWAATGDGRFDVAGLEKCLSGSLDGAQKLRSTEEHCPTAVTTSLMDMPGIPVWLRSYSNLSATDGPPTGRHEWTIREAARATSAAPVYFVPVEVFGSSFQDAGSAGFNNPTELAITEARALLPGRDIGCVVSIGTGVGSAIHKQPRTQKVEVDAGLFRQWKDRYTNLANAKERIESLAGYFVKIATDTDRTHQRLSNNPDYHGLYFRFDVPQLGDMDLADLDHGQIRRFTRHYLARADTRKLLDECAAKLKVRDAPALRAPVQSANQHDMVGILPRYKPEAIPPFPVPFIGRDDKVNDIVGALLGISTGVGIAILGTGGIGKTEVATAVLHHHSVEKTYGASRFFIRCDSATANSPGATVSGPSGGNAASQLVGLMATQLGLNMSAGDTDELGVPRGRAADKLWYFFSRRPSVLVLDNFETLWDGSGPEFDELIKRLRALPNLRLIVTMRGNVTPGVDWCAKPLSTLDVESAREVFIRHSGKAEFRCDPIMDKLLGDVDCLPLAIVLLAVQAKAKPDLQSLWEEWERCRTDMLEDERYRQGADRAQLFSLEASIQLSLKRPLMIKNPPALTLLSLLSVLPDGAAWSDLKALVPSTSLSPKQRRPEEVLLRLALAYTASSRPGQTSMRDTSRHNTSGQIDDRLRILGPIRDYMQHKYPPEEADYERLRKHYLEIAISHKNRTLLRRLGPDIHNLEAVTVQALSVESEQQLAVHAAEVICDFCSRGGIALPALLHRLVEILPITRNAPLLGNVQFILGRMALRQRNLGDAKERFESALALYEGVSDKLGKAHCIRSLGQLALTIQYDCEAARQRLEEALALYEGLHDSQGKADCIRGLGLLSQYQSNYKEARQRLEEALALYHGLNDRMGKANCILNLGLIAENQYDYEGGRQKLEEALALYEGLGDELGKATCIRSLGRPALNQPNLDESIQRLEEALALYESLADNHGKADCIYDLGCVSQDQSNYEAAGRRFEAALAVYEVVNDKVGKAHCVRGLGQVALSKSIYEEARQRLDEAFMQYEDISHNHGKANCIRNLGRLALYQKNYGEGRQRFEEAIALYEGLSDKLGKASCLSNLGTLVLHASNYEECEEAQPRFEQALALYEAINDSEGKAQCLRMLVKIKDHIALLEGLHLSSDRAMNL